MKNRKWFYFLPNILQSKLEGRTKAQTVIANTGWLTVDKAVKLLVGIIIGTWVARYLGPKEYGELSYLIVYVSLFQVIASLGLDGIIVRELARNQETDGETLGSAATLKLCLGFICWIVSTIGIGISTDWEIRSLILITLIGSGLFLQSADIVDLWFQSQNQIRKSVIAKLAGFLISNLIRVALILLEAPITLFAFVIFLDFLLMATCLAIAYKFYPSKHRWATTVKKCKELIGYSWPLCISSLIGLIQARVEYLIIEKALGMESVGQYAAALRWIEFFSVPGVILCTAIYPILAVSISNIDEKIRQLYFLIVSIFLLTIPFMILTWAYMESIYGKEYLTAKGLFIFMIVRPLLAYIGTVRSISIKLDNFVWYDLFCAAIGAVIAITFATYLIKTHGLLGAVLSGYISYLFSNFLLDLIFYRKNFVNLLKSFSLFLKIVPRR